MAKVKCGLIQMSLKGDGNMQPEAIRDAMIEAHIPYIEDAAHQGFNRLENVFLLNKAHLDVELIELPRAAVGAGIFVAETRRDLEIAVKAGDHDQLFELLRRLRQGVHFAGMQARGHEEVARAFGRGRCQDRRLIFHKAKIDHALPD